MSQQKKIVIQILPSSIGIIKDFKLYATELNFKSVKQLLVNIIKSNINLGLIDILRYKDEIVLNNLTKRVLE